MPTSTDLRIEGFTKKGDASLNEDALIINEALQVYGVVDGATSLTPYRNQEGFTGGYIAGRLVASSFEQMNQDQSLEQVVLEANNTLQEQMVAEGVDVNDSSALWSAACVVIRIHPYSIEYIQAGDCMLLCQYKDGSVRVLTHPQVAHVDQKTLDRIAGLRDQGVVDPIEIRQHLMPFLQENRKKTNTLEGYGVVNGSPNFPHFLEKGTFNRANLKSLYMVSDGLFTGLTSWSDLVASIDKQGLTDFAESIFKMEEADGELLQFPRVKRSDDKTGIVLHFP